MSGDADRSEHDLAELDVDSRGPAPGLVPSEPEWIEPPPPLDAVATDARGNTGLISVLISVWPKPPDHRSAFFNARPDVDLVRFQDDFSSWETYRTIRISTIAYRIQPPRPQGTGIYVREQYGPNGLRLYLVTLQLVQDIRTRLIGEVTWTPGEGVEWAIRSVEPATDRPTDYAPILRAMRVAGGVRIGLGGRPMGSTKGRRWSRMTILEWYGVASDTYASDREPTLVELADAMGLKDPETARKRVDQAGLHWPPTPAELDELNEGE
jgi:hypothetical protein